MFAVSKNPTIRESRALYKQGKSTPIQIVQFFLNRSKQVDREIKAVLRYPEKLTIEEAKHCEYLLQEYQSKETSSWFEDLLQDYPLFGIPYSLKDNILVAGEIVTSGSKILQDYRASYSATAYLKVKQAGAILLSQTNQDEFAMGSSTENSAYQITRNPLDLDRVPVVLRVARQRL
jgi:Asp-tRNAAsn/Glu-tRNAGln amidotransferase A subunit and related amidases